MDAYTIALTLLSRRELSIAQLRERLVRRGCPSASIDRAVERLTADGTLDDRRVALAAARTATLKGRGRRRAVHDLERLGIDAALAAAAVDEVFGEIDERALLDRAIERRLKGAAPASLDARGKARLVRGLVARGFEPGAVFARLRQRGADPDE